MITISDTQATLFCDPIRNVFTEEMQKKEPKTSYARFAIYREHIMYIPVQ